MSLNGNQEGRPDGPKFDARSFEIPSTIAISDFSQLGQRAEYRRFLVSLLQGSDCTWLLKNTVLDNPERQSHQTRSGPEVTGHELFTPSRAGTRSRLSLSTMKSNPPSLSSFAQPSFSPSLGEGSQSRGATIQPSFSTPLGASQSRGMSRMGTHLGDRRMMGARMGDHPGNGTQKIEEEAIPIAHPRHSVTRDGGAFQVHTIPGRTMARQSAQLRKEFYTLDPAYEPARGKTPRPQHNSGSGDFNPTHSAFGQPTGGSSPSSTMGGTQAEQSTSDASMRAYMDAKTAQYNTTLQVVMEKMESLSKQNNAVFQRMDKWMESAQRPIDTLALTNQGAEDWVVEQHLTEDLVPEYRWWDVEYGCWETAKQTKVRWCLYGNIMKTLPRLVWVDVIHGDVRAIYEKLVSFGLENAASQVAQLLKGLTEYAPKKKDVDMTTWLAQMNEYWIALTQLRQPMPMSQCRFHILEALKPDSRYADLIKDIKRHTSWPMAMIQGKMSSVAGEVGDLYPSSAKKGNLGKGTRRKSNQAAKEADDADDSSKGSGGAQPGKKGNVGVQQKAHPQGSAAAAPAGGPAPDAKRREQLKHEVCKPFLVHGHCKYGSDCFRSHETMDALKKSVQSQKGRANGANPSGGMNQSSSPAGVDSDGKKLCYSFRDNGKCTFENRCKFSHNTGADTPKKAKVATKHRATLAPLKVGDDVFVSPKCPIKGLRHVEGTVFAVQGQWYRVQLQWDSVCPPPVQQWIDNAESIGVPRSMLWKLDADDARRLAMAARRGTDHTTTCEDPFSLCAILDSGCNFMSTGDARLIRPDTLQEYSEPSATNGIGGVKAYATHHGTMTLRVGDMEMDVPVDYVPGGQNTLVNASYFDDSKNFYLKLKDECVWLHAYPEEGQGEGPMLHKFPRNLTNEVADRVSHEFLQDLERVDKGVRHTLYPIPDSFFVLHDINPTGKALCSKTEQKGANQ